LASAGNEGVLRVWEVATGKQLVATDTHPAGAAIDAVAFAPDGKSLTSGVGLYDAATGRKLREFRGHDERVVFARFSPDGKSLATRDFNGQIRIWDVETGRKILEAGPIYSPVIFTTAGRALVLRASDGKPAELYDLIADSTVCTLSGFKGRLHSWALSPDGESLASLAYAGNPAGARADVGPGAGFVAALWDAHTGAELRSFRPKEDAFSIAFSPDGKILFLGGNTTLSLWDAATGKFARTIEDCWGASMTLSADGKTLAAVGTNTAIRVWDVASGRELHPDRGHEGPICQVTFSPDSKRLLTAGSDGTVRTWNAATGRETQRFSGIGYAPRMALSADGRLLATGSSFPPKAKWPIRLWDTATGKETRRIEGFEGAAQSLAFCPDGKTLAAFTCQFYPQDAVVRIWDVATGKQQAQVDAPGRAGHSSAEVAFTPDGELLASTLGDNSIRFWVPANGQEETRVELPERSAFHFALSPDGKKLAIATLNPSELHVLERSGKAMFRILGPVNGVTFSPDGRLLAGGSHRGDVRIWSATTGKELHRLPGHGWFSVVTFAPDGRHLATAGSDTTAVIWDLAALKLSVGKGLD
jgi:WD40 repeat protein